jgi:hypothetical protein
MHHGTDGVNRKFRRSPGPRSAHLMAPPDAGKNASKRPVSSQCLFNQLDGCVFGEGRDRWRIEVDGIRDLSPCRWIQIRAFGHFPQSIIVRTNETVDGIDIIAGLATWLRTPPDLQLSVQPVYRTVGAFESVRA